MRIRLLNTEHLTLNTEHLFKELFLYLWVDYPVRGPFACEEFHDRVSRQAGHVFARFSIDAGCVGSQQDVIEAEERVASRGLLFEDIQAGTSNSAPLFLTLPTRL